MLSLVWRYDAKIKASMRTLIRKICGRLAALINRVFKGKVTPDHVTVAGLLMHLPIAVLIAKDNLIWAAVMLLIFGLFDVLDGELARLQGVDNARGMLFDATSDRLKETLIYAGSAYWLVNHYPEWSWVAVVACGVSITVSYAKAKGEAALALKRKITDHQKLNRHFKEGLVPFEIRMTIIFLGLLSGQVLLATALVAVLATITVFGRLKIIGGQL
jgi:phosphatidylglycerophosphate synthase